MNAPDVLQNIRSKHPVAYLVLYLFVGWALLIVITHAIAFGAELLIVHGEFRHMPGSAQEDRKSTRLNSSHSAKSRMPSSA